MHKSNVHRINEVMRLISFLQVILGQKEPKSKFEPKCSTADSYNLFFFNQSH